MLPGPKGTSWHVPSSLTQTMTPGKQHPAHLRELGKDDVGHLLVLLVVAGQPGQILRAFIFYVIPIPILGIVVLIIPALSILCAHAMSACNSLSALRRVKQHRVT